MIDSGMSHMGFRCIVRPVSKPEEEVRSLETHRDRDQEPAGQKLHRSIRHFFKQFRILRRAFLHPQVPWHAKAVAGCAVLYIVSPIQLIPNFIPVIGQMDDVLVVSLGLKYLRRNVPQSVLDECEGGVRSRHVPKILEPTVSDPLPNLRS
jgi:uncharacterized membrane protein YkvA (DUF1232 family)